MKARLLLPVVTLLALAPLIIAQDNYYGSATYTPQQLHELLVGQNRDTVLQTFGRMPNFMKGHDWFYENVAVYVPERDQYYTLAVVCFSQTDGRVWQVVCYPH